MPWVWVDDDDPRAQVGHDHVWRLSWEPKPNTRLRDAPAVLDSRDAQETLWEFAQYCKERAVIPDEMMDYAAFGAGRFSQGEKPPWPTRTGRRPEVLPGHAKAAAMGVLSHPDVSCTFAEAVRGLFHFYPNVDQRTLEAAIKRELDRMKDGSS